MRSGGVPAVLTRGGLRAAGGAVTSRTPVPVELDVPVAEFAGGDAPFTFVGGVANAIERARAAAGGKDVKVICADVAHQAIRAGLLDEIIIRLVPAILGDVKRLFEHLGAAPIELERTHVVEAPDGVTHLRFMIVR